MFSIRINLPSCKLYFFASLLWLAFVVGKVFNMIPVCQKMLQKLFLKWTRCRVHPEEFWHTMFNTEMRNTLLHILWRDLVKRAFLHGPAIDVPVLCLDGKIPRRCNLLDFQKPGRPLVINFGSCSWPEFMVDLQQFNKMVRRYQGQVDFLVLYIEEAHPVDGWAFKVKQIEKELK